MICGAFVESTVVALFTALLVTAMMSSAFILSCLVLLVLAQLVFSIQLQPHQQGTTFSCFVTALFILLPAAIVFGFDKRRSGDLVVTQEPSDADVYVIFPSTPSSTSTSLSSVPLTALSSLSAASIGIVLRLLKSETRIDQFVFQASTPLPLARSRTFSYNHTC